MVDPDDIGLSEIEGKFWIFWLGEGKISQLRKKQIIIFSEGSKDRLLDILNGKTRKLGNSFYNIIKVTKFFLFLPSKRT